ncbi:hypothetical protein ACFW7K_17940 [Streptomyces sp. NPDC058735]|uniref:hypothetical protein n=1 Tax=Streptomyces sp. NPDC058735 TaxID=3346616 RepID=UPI0036801735
MMEFANYLDGLLARLDPSGGWCAVFWQRDPEGVRACLDGREVPPWDVVESLLHDLSGRYGPGGTGPETEHARLLHTAALYAFDDRPGGRDALGDQLDLMLREQEYAAERQGGLSRRLASAPTREQADALRLDLAWARDDHERASARCAELRARIARLDRPGHRVPGGDADGYADAGRRLPGPAQRADRGDARAAPESRGGGTEEDEGRSGPGPVPSVAGGAVASRRGPSTGGYTWQEAEPDSGGAAATPLAGPRPSSGLSASAARSAPGGQAPAPGHSAAPGFPAAATPTPWTPAVRPAPAPAPAPAEPHAAPTPEQAPRSTPTPEQAPRSRRTPTPTPSSAKLRKRRRGGARFAGAVEEQEAVPVEVPPAAVPALPSPAPTTGRTPRGARFAGAAEDAAGEGTAPAAETVGAPDRAEVARTVEALARLRGEGRGGEAHVLLAEAASWEPARLPLLAEELGRAGLDADWQTLLWEAASLPTARLVAAADALVAAGRAGDGRQMLRQGVARPPGEVGRAVLGLVAEAREREVRVLLDAYVRARAPEEAARSVEPDPQRLVPLLLQAARAVSDELRRDLVHALRVAGHAA